MGKIRIYYPLTLHDVVSFDFLTFKFEFVPMNTDVGVHVLTLKT